MLAIRHFRSSCRRSGQVLGYAERSKVKIDNFRPDILKPAWPPIRRVILVDHNGSDSLRHVVSCDAGGGGPQLEGQAVLKVAEPSRLSQRSQRDFERGGRLISERLQRLRCPMLRTFPEPADDRLDGNGSVAFVDPRPCVREHAGGRLDCEAAKATFDDIRRAVAQRGNKIGSPSRRDVDVREAGKDGVRSSATSACQRQMGAEFARRPRQEVSGADVRNEADAGLGHCQHCRLRHHAMSAMGRDANTASHHYSAHDRDNRLGVSSETGIELVFVGPERDGTREVARSRGVVDRPDVAAGAKTALSRAVDKDKRDPVVALPIREGLMKQADHAVRKRVQRFGAIQRQATEPPLDPR